MKKIIRGKESNFMLILLCLGLIGAFCLPTPGQASISTATGSAWIDWANATWSGPTLTWLDQNSLSSAYVGLNGFESDYTLSDFYEGKFVSTSFTGALTDVSGSATGMGATGGNSALIDTNPTVTLPDGTIIDNPNYQQPLPNQNLATTIYAFSNISVNSGLNGGFAQGDVFLASAALTGQFTVANAGTLSLIVPYSINLSAFSGTGGSANADALVGLYLSDFNNETLLASDTRFPNTTIDGSPYLKSGFLTLNYNLLAGVSYDFEASASIIASASAVPEPSTLMFLGSGLLGLVAFRRRFF